MLHQFVTEKYMGQPAPARLSLQVHLLEARAALFAGDAALAVTALHRYFDYTGARGFACTIFAFLISPYPHEQHLPFLIAQEQLQDFNSEQNI